MDNNGSRLLYNYPDVVKKIRTRRLRRTWLVGRMDDNVAAKNI